MPRSAPCRTRAEDTVNKYPIQSSTIMPRTVSCVACARSHTLPARVTRAGVVRLSQEGQCYGLQSTAPPPFFLLEPSSQGERVYAHHRGQRGGRPAQTRPSALPLGGSGAPLEPTGAAINVWRWRQVNTSVSRTRHPPQAVHCPLLPVAAVPSPSCSRNAPATDPASTHHRTTVFTDESTGNKPTMASPIDQAKTAIAAVEAFEDTGESIYPEQILLQLIKAAELLLDFLKQEKDRDDYLEAKRLLDLIMLRLYHDIGHDCARVCEVCTGITRVMATYREVFGA